LEIMEETTGMSAQKEEYTLGVEEEYQILDPETRELLARGGHAVQQRAQRALGEEAMPELLTSQVEAISPVCHTLAEVRAEILRLRREVSEAAAKQGGRIAAASTHPFSHWQEQPVTPKGRYRNIVENYQRLSRQQLAFGLHVHVGLKDREAAVRVMNLLRVWLAPMLASRPAPPSGSAKTPATLATARRSEAGCRRRGCRHPLGRALSTTPWWRP
jgi:glutamate---cysteine ligase / carboxylate-amine ligase